MILQNTIAVWRRHSTNIKIAATLGIVHIIFLKMAEVKLFGKWSYEDVTVADLSLHDYIAVTQKSAQVWLPHTAGRYQKKRFRKATCPITERLVCGMMMTHRNNGSIKILFKNVQISSKIHSKRCFSIRFSCKCPR